MPRTADPLPAGASMGARTGGYLVDMVIFAAIAMIVIVFAGFLLLATTDWAKKDPSDPQFYTFLAIIGMGTPLIWSALNLLLLATRGQTGGQYVAALKLTREDGAALTARDGAAWWFCFNPLLFSWPMAGVAGLPLAAASAADLVTRTGFGVLAVCRLATTLLAFRSIRRRDIPAPQRWSCALTLAAVTLRIHMPVSQVMGIQFEDAYRVVAWICWVTNLVIVESWFVPRGWPSDGCCVRKLMRRLSMLGLSVNRQLNLFRRRMNSS